MEPVLSRIWSVTLVPEARLTVQVKEVALVDANDSRAAALGCPPGMMEGK
jgi:hypothetical protein